jgi:hypothetical protein
VAGGTLNVATTRDDTKRIKAALQELKTPPAEPSWSNDNISPDGPAKCVKREQLFEPLLSPDHDVTDQKQNEVMKFDDKLVDCEFVCASKSFGRSAVECKLIHGDRKPIMVKGEPKGKCESKAVWRKAEVQCSVEMIVIQFKHLKNKRGNCM